MSTTECVASVAGLTHQRELWTDLTPDAAVAIVGPLGCGKSFALAWKAADLAARNGTLDGVLVLPTYSIGERVHRYEWPEVLSAGGVDVEWRGGTNPRIYWPWGGSTWVVSADRPIRIVAASWAYAILDEPAQMPREAWERVSGRIRHPRAVLRQRVLGGTPEGDTGWFAELFRDPEPGSGRRTIYARGWHPSLVPQYPALLVETYGYDPAALATYARGHSALGHGTVYSCFSRPRHVRPEADVRAMYSAALPLVLTCDFNVDHMRWLVMQLQDGAIVVLDEIAPGRGTRTVEAAREFVRRWKPRHVGRVTVCGDATGTARKTSAAQTDYDEIRDVVGGAGFRELGLRIPRENPRVRDAVHAVQFNLDGRGGREVVIGEHCRELIRDLEGVRWRSGLGEIDKRDERRTHASDALRYALWQLARPRISRSVRPKATRVRSPVLAQRY